MSVSHRAVTGQGVLRLRRGHVSCDNASGDDFGGCSANAARHAGAGIARRAAFHERQRAAPLASTVTYCFRATRSPCLAEATQTPTPQPDLHNGQRSPGASIVISFVTSMVGFSHLGSVRYSTLPFDVRPCLSVSLSVDKRGPQVGFLFTEHS